MTNDYQPMLDKLARDKAQALDMGGTQAVDRHRQRGKLTCRERLDYLLDPGSFVERGVLAKSRVQVPGREERVAMAGGVVIGLGTIDGRPVLVVADDATVVSGARGASGRAKANRMYRMAQEYNIPLISLMEASASRVQDQMGSKLWAGLGFDPHTTGFGDYIDLSGRVPLVAAVMGAAVGGPAFNACMSDFVTMVRDTSFMAVSGPPVVLGATGEESSGEELGGADVHARQTGQIDHVGDTETASLDAIRRFLSYFPTSSDALPPRQQQTDDPQRRCEELYDLVPTNQRRAYDMRRVITTIVDHGDYFELKPDYGRGIITCLARLHGHPVGIVGNQPTHLAGVMDDQASYKAIHFMDVCDAFHIPLVFLVDVPGFIIGREWERKGMLKWVARSLRAHRQLSVPKLTVVIRKAYGLAYWIVGGKAMRPDLLVAWPTASFSLMAPQPAINVVYQRALAAADDPEAKRRELLDLFAQRFAPDDAAEQFDLDDIIDPADTRRVLISGLEMALHRRRPGFKHPIYP